MAKSDDVSAVEKKTGPLLNVARQPIQKSFAPIPLSPLCCGIAGRAFSKKQCRA